jgi:hypothetical protein
MQLDLIVACMEQWTTTSPPRDSHANYQIVDSKGSCQKHVVLAWFTKNVLAYGFLLVADQKVIQDGEPRTQQALRG